MKLKRQPIDKDSKIATTRIIWSFATGMMVICIPLVALSRSGVILPLTVVLGASASTVAVWRDKERQTSQINHLNGNFRAIEQRVVDLETICSHKELDVDQKFHKLELGEIAQTDKREIGNR